MPRLKFPFLTVPSVHARTYVTPYVPLIGTQDTERALRTRSTKMYAAHALTVPLVHKREIQRFETKFRIFQQIHAYFGYFHKFHAYLGIRAYFEGILQQIHAYFGYLLQFTSRR